jgi:lysophospholipase L1-like esterase
MKKNMYIFLLCFLVSIIVSGCGGSSGNNNPEPEVVSDDVSVVVEGLDEEEPQLSLYGDVYIAIGCGITSGSSPTVGDPWPELLSVKGIHIRNLGVSGTQSSYGASHIDENMNNYRPSIVMVLYGVNDISAGISTSAIIDNLEQIIQVVQYYGGEVIVGTIPIVTKYSGSEASSARSLNGRIEQVCSSYGIECADVAGKMGYDPDLYLDGLHPTPEGQEYISAAFRSKIRKITGQ